MARQRPSGLFLVLDLVKAVVSREGTNEAPACKAAPNKTLSNEKHLDQAQKKNKMKRETTPATYCFGFCSSENSLFGFGRMFSVS